MCAYKEYNCNLHFYYGSISGHRDRKLEEKTTLSPLSKITFLILHYLILKVNIEKAPKMVINKVKKLNFNRIWVEMKVNNYFFRRLIPIPDQIYFN